MSETENDAVEDCPVHSTYWLNAAVRNNRVLLDLPPQPCTCGGDIPPALDAGEAEGLTRFIAERYDYHPAAIADAVLASDWLAAHVAAKQAEAWERGRQHGERNFISCPDDNPYRAATLGDAS